MAKKKIIFLDIDGCMNTKEALAKQGWNAIDPKSVVNLDRVVKATGAKVVISSTWRLYHTIEKMQEILNNNGFTGEIIGMTPKHIPYKMLDEWVDRGEEIQYWLDNDFNGKPCTFIILDDDNDMAHLKHRLIQTNIEEGFTNEILVQRAIRMLNRGKTEHTQNDS